MDNELTKYIPISTQESMVFNGTSFQDPNFTQEEARVFKVKSVTE